MLGRLIGVDTSSAKLVVHLIPGDIIPLEHRIRNLDFVQIQSIISLVIRRIDACIIALQRLTNMTYSIAICNQKGGVAKTTTCLSLGGCLADMGTAVLLIDLDPQANLTASLIAEPETLYQTVGDVLQGRATVLSASQETKVLGMDLLPAIAGLATLDKSLYPRPDYEALLKNAVSAAGPALYDYILMDCPPSFGPLTLNALTMADMMIIPTQAEYYALRSLQNVFQLIELVRHKTNPALRYRIVVTMYDRRNSISSKTLQQIREAFRKVLFDTVIEVDTRLRESPFTGLPITAYKPDTRAAQQYRALAKEVVEHE
jgi:chromosome partitioning protein